MAKIVVVTRESSSNGLEGTTIVGVYSSPEAARKDFSDVRWGEDPYLRGNLNSGVFNDQYYDIAEYELDKKA